MSPRIDGIAGVATLRGSGPKSLMMTDINSIRLARHLTRKGRKYFIGELDPCASIGFSRGCAWDCSLCSAWTFYGRSYRQADPAVVAEEMKSIRAPNATEHDMALVDEIEKRKIRKRYYLETRCDVLIRNQEVFAR